jgi:hypothetical protein
MWKEEWPQEKGFYWFYGYFGRTSKEPDLYFVEVSLEFQGKPIYIIKGMFLYKVETGYGFWTPAIVPEIPDIGDKDIERIKINCPNF